MRLSPLAGILVLFAFHSDAESDPASAALRLEVKPPEAEVYVDSYLAGIVDEFDGFFQRLHLSPGTHEIVIYLDGYRPIREKLRVIPGASYKLRRDLEPLAPGEASEPPPEPPVEEPSPSEPPSGFGVLELRALPPADEILIDGDPWPVEESRETLVLHLPAGEHRIQLRRANHPPFETEVRIAPGKTTNLNVKLPQ